MSALMDVAYLDAPYIAHVDRKTFLLRMSTDCWEDNCFACTRPGCLCACHDNAVPEIPRCRKCRYPVNAIGHLATCEPEWLAARIQGLADGIARAA